MELKRYSDSQVFFEIVPDPALMGLNHFEGWLLCLKDFGKKLLFLPLALLYKAGKTFFRSIGLFLGAGLILVTLGTSGGIREFFIRRATSLTKDVVDWVLIPFAILSCFCRLILALLLHPKLYFNAH